MKFRFEDEIQSDAMATEIKEEAQSEEDTIPRPTDLTFKAPPAKVQKTSHESSAGANSSRYYGPSRSHYLQLDAFSRHKQFVNNYLRFFGGSMKDFQRDTSRDKRDIDVIKENHRFLWNEEDDPDDSWEKQLAKKYYDKLFKEYCICDLSRYKENKVAMRWRIEKEVVDGKGQFSCGEKKCRHKEGLKSWEANFAYREFGERKNALVKLRLCPECSRKLNYHHKKKEAKKAKPAADVKTEESADTGTAVKEEPPSPARPGERAPPGDVTRSRTGDKAAAAADDAQAAANIWSAPLKITEEKSRSEEFDDYFEDMFL